MRRFLLHVLPDGFHRIRHYGLFANGHRADKLALCRKLLDVPPCDRLPSDEDAWTPMPMTTIHRPAPVAAAACSVIETFERGTLATLVRPVMRLDTS